MAFLQEERNSSVWYVSTRQEKAQVIVMRVRHVLEVFVLPKLGYFGKIIF